MEHRARREEKEAEEKEVISGSSVELSAQAVKVRSHYLASADHVNKIHASDWVIPIAFLNERARLQCERGFKRRAILE